MENQNAPKKRIFSGENDCTGRLEGVNGDENNPGLPPRAPDLLWRVTCPAEKRRERWRFRPGGKAPGTGAWLVGGGAACSLAAYDVLYED